MRARRFLGWASASILIALASFTALNIFVDPYAECGTGRLLPDDRDSHSRVLKVALLRQHRLPPQVLILGNSRSLHLSPATARHITGLRGFNAAVANGTLWDVLAFLRFTLAQPQHDLRVVVIGLDTFMVLGAIGEPHEELRYFPLVRYLPEASPPLAEAQLLRIARLSSADTAATSARLLYYSVMGPPERLLTFDPNGMIRFARFDDSIAKGRWRGPLAGGLANVRRQYLVNFGGHPDLYGPTLKVLEDVLEAAQDAGAQVVLFMPPLHSGLAEELGRESYYLEHLALTHDYLQGIAQRYQCAFHDLSTVDRFGGDDRGFIDGTHMIGPNNDLVLQAVLKDIPSGQRGIR
jgi:hypothetical protein